MPRWAGRHCPGLRCSCASAGRTDTIFESFGPGLGGIGLLAIDSCGDPDDEKRRAVPAKGRIGLLWWLLSLILGPIATFLIAVMPNVGPVSSAT